MASSIVCGKRLYSDDACFPATADVSGDATPMNSSKRSRRYVSPPAIPLTYSSETLFSATSSFGHSRQMAAALDGAAPTGNAGVAEGGGGVIGRSDYGAVHGKSVPASREEADGEGGNALASQWVGAVVEEMMKSADMDDAHRRAGGLLLAFEQAVGQKIAAEQHKLTCDVHSRLDENLLQQARGENLELQQRLQVFERENGILKRAVAIQHERQKQEQEARGRELQQLKEELQAHHEQMRTLEMTNYALTVHLRAATHSTGPSAMATRFPPDVY
eukprot:TRINITY_DN1500_c0_g1_i1.p1 TRINITY_DN1500_c0_g1~~TRINITY_DN1500_c0_g1_i1.p1  ORF type:complete len:275 (-),score=93.22 TRINITY_DN1500_c0_g1_i1:367-1191(-)